MTELNNESELLIKNEEDRVSSNPELFKATKDVAGVAGERLKSFIERVERLDEEKKNIAEDIKEVFGEAKATGFDTKIMRKIIKLRKQDLESRQEEEQLTELYLSAIGDL